MSTDTQRERSDRVIQVHLGFNTAWSHETIGEPNMGHRIAVIDRDDALCELIRRWLVDAGHAVQTHPSMACVGDVGLVIADVPSPREARPLLVELLRPAGGAAVLLLSARFRKGQEGSIPLADELGVKGVLPKPFTKRQLLLAVSQALRRAETSQPRTTSTLTLKM